MAQIARPLQPERNPHMNAGTHATRPQGQRGQAGTALPGGRLPPPGPRDQVRRLRSQKKTPGLEVSFRVIDTFGDEAESMRAELDETNPKWRERPKKTTIYVTDDTEWRLTQFEKQLGLDVGPRTIPRRPPIASWSRR